MSLPKWIDIPPLWLALHVAAAWVLAPYLPIRWNAPWLLPAGTFLIGMGLALMALAVFSMWRARTTVIPHREPGALVPTGIFALTRNPIYLGDTLILAGAVLRTQTPPLLVLVPVLGWILSRRFIEPEEARLRRHFGDAFEAYCSRTKRWLGRT